MTAQEMLIEVNTSLQAIGASRTRKYFPQEIEWYLNKIQNRFIQNCIRKKPSESPYRQDGNETNLFEIDEMYRDAIREVIAPEIFLPVNYIPSGNSAMAFLPSDYSYMLDVGASGELCTAFDFTKLQQNQYQILGVPFPADSTQVSGYFFQNLTVALNGTTIYIRSGNYTYPSAFQLIEEIISNTSMAVDRIGSYIYPGYILMLVPKPLSSNAQFTITYESATLTSVVLNTFTANETGIISGDVNVPTRSVNNSNTFNSSTTPYYKTSVKEVTTKTIGSVIYVDTTTNFIVNGIVISYIRKPRRISVSLNIGSEIAPEFHPQICDMTVSHIRERIGDPKYQTGLVDSKQ